MIKFIKNLNYVPLAYKFMLPYLILVLLTDLTIGIYSYTSTVNNDKNNTKANISRTLDQMNDNITYRIQSLQNILEYNISNDYEIQTMMALNDNEYNLYYLTSNLLFPKLTSSINLSPCNVRLSLYTYNLNLREVYTPVEQGRDPLQFQSSYNIYYMQRIQEQDWYQEFMSRKTDNIWMQIGDDAAFGNITLIKKILNYRGFSQIGIITATVKVSDIFQVINVTEMSDTADVMVFQKNSDEILYNRLKDKSGLNWSELDKSEYWVTVKDLEYSDWQLISIISKQEIINQARSVAKVTVFVCLVSFAVMGLIGVFIAIHFSRRVKCFVKSMSAFMEGDLSNRIHVEGNDELLKIGVAFNEMAENIEGLINEVYVSGIQKKEAELETLQAQINPHFLFNTLSTINTLVNMEDLEGLRQMVSSLVIFYRVSLSNGKTIISIDEEIQQVNAYINIQKIKYRDRLSITYQVKEELLKYNTIKLILQPFVENSLKHAWYNNHIHIKIVVEESEEGIVFLIIDDGIGISDEILEQLQKENSELVGYGIFNVNQRIKLNFGENYGVKISSELGKGTTVRILIPKVSN